MKVVLPADTTFVQINRIPVELCVCRKDFKFNTILNHSDWGTFKEPKYDLSYMFFDTISSFRKVDRWFIICPKHMCRFDLVFCTSEEKMHQFQSNNGGHDSGRQREWRISNLPRF